MTFEPTGKSGPIIISAPFASLNSLGSLSPPGTNCSSAPCPTVAGVVMNFSTSSSHFALDSSTNFEMFGSLPVICITAKILPRLVFAVFSHFLTSSGFLIFTMCEWNFELMYSCNSLGVDSEIKHATLPPFFMMCWARYSTLCASDFSVASTVKTTDLPVKSGWWTPGVVVPMNGFTG